MDLLLNTPEEGVIIGQISFVARLHFSREERLEQLLARYLAGDTKPRRHFTHTRALVSSA